MSRPGVRPSIVVVLLAGVVALAGCAPDGYGEAAPTTPVSGSTSTSSPDPTRSVSPSPTSTAEATPDIPTDCRSILSDAVLAQLEGVPLNDPATGESTGVQPDGSLVCLWRDARADTSFLSTTISPMSSGPALDMLNGLVANDAFSCFTPDEGTRCEKTWPNLTYPVTDGRTLFYRAGLLVDTRYSNLAPSGYTSSIIERLYG